MVINRSLIDSYADKELIEFLYSNFRERVPVQMEILKGVCASADQSQTKKVLHALKNLFGNIGDESSAALCQQIENNVGEAGCQVVWPSLPVLEEKYVHAHQELKKIIDEKFGTA